MTCLKCFQKFPRDFCRVPCEFLHGFANFSYRLAEIPSLFRGCLQLQCRLARFGSFAGAGGVTYFIYAYIVNPCLGEASFAITTLTLGIV